MLISQGLSRNNLHYFELLVILFHIGEVQEWLNWPLSKSGEPQGSEGSNPSLSANIISLV